MRRRALGQSVFVASMSSATAAAIAARASSTPAAINNALASLCFPVAPGVPVALGVPVPLGVPVALAVVGP